MDFVTFELPLKVAPDASAGRQDLLTTVRYLACDDRQCLPLATVTLKVPVEILR